MLRESDDQGMQILAMKLGYTSIRQAWFSLSPKMADSNPLQGSEWEAEFTEWAITGTGTNRELKVGDPDKSVTVKLIF